MNKKPILTIAIPTWNRNEILLENLKLLIPQLNEQCELLILDNASTIPVEKFLREHLPEFKRVPFGLRFVRNVSNIGGCANIVRSLELSNGTWTWLLGDDDSPLPDAIEKILSHLKDFDGFIVNFSSVFDENRRVQGRGRFDFLKFVSLHNLTFMSSNIYKTEIIKDRLYWGYDSLHMAAPHVALAIVAADSEAQFYLSNEEILLRIPFCQGEGWNSLRGYSKLILLHEVLFWKIRSDELKILKKKIFYAHGLNSCTFVLKIFIMILIHSRNFPQEFIFYQHCFSNWVKHSPTTAIREKYIKFFALILTYLLPYHQLIFPFASFFMFLLKKDINRAMFPSINQLNF